MTYEDPRIAPEDARQFDMATRTGRDCMDCGESAHLPVVDSAGTMYGYLCTPCDRRARRRRMGWKRHLRTLRRALSR